MDYQTYVDQTQKVSNAVEANDFDTGLRILEDLVMSDLPDIDKAMMCLNLGVVWEKKGNAAEALRQYDRGIRYEKPHKRCRVQQEKVQYLIRLKRKEEALAIVDEMIEYPFLNLNEKDSYRAWYDQIKKS